MNCDSTNTNPCKTCNQGIDIPTCTKLCDFIVETDCVQLSEDIECLGSQGDDLTTALKNFCDINEESYINNVQLEDTNLTFTGVGSAFDGIIDLSGLVGPDDDWTKDVNGVWNNTDNIGIGTNTPNFNLDVVGDSNQLFNNTNYITNANVNIPTLFGNPPITGDVSIMRYSDAKQNTVMWVGSQFAQVAVDTPNYVTGFTASSLSGSFIKTDDGVDSTELTIFPAELKIDGISGATGSFTTIEGKTITVTKGITTDIASGIGGGFGITNVLSASDTTDQTPGALNSALQVTFGPAQGTLADPVMVDAAGVIRFNETGQYLFNGYANFARGGLSGGTAVIAFRALFNGAQAGVTKVVDIKDADDIVPYDLTMPISATAGDTLTWEIMRDGIGSNYGGLYTQALAGGWDPVPSVSINIYKVGI